MPSSFFDPSFSLRRLRTTPARNPRTECCCQPVAFIIASIVAPADDFSIAMTQACLVPGSLFCRFVLLAANCASLATATRVADGTAARFFADFDIENLRSVGGGHRAATTEAPGRPNGAGGEPSLRRRGSGFAEPVDYAGSVEECVYVGNDFFKAEGNFNGLPGSSGARADLGCR